MIIKKINKHCLITSRRIMQAKELRRLGSHSNGMLSIVRDAFLATKASDFTTDQLNAFKRCENYRNHLLKDENVITYEVFNSNRTALVKDICKSAASSERWCQFLFMISHKIDNPIILEIGTNLGLSGSYILEAIKDKKEAIFITMEGLPQLCTISENKFKTITSTDKFSIKQGLYDQTFNELLKENINFNCFFIDGNHRKTATLEYFNELKSKLNNPAIFIFDDINWSLEMQEAWIIIKDDIDVNYSIDLYEQGIVIVDSHEITKNCEFELHLSYS